MARNGTLIQQVMAHVRAGIASRSYLPGTRLPSVRQQAGLLGMSVSTVVEAYERLAANVQGKAAWFVSAGNDRDQRSAAVMAAVKAGRLEQEQAAAYLPSEAVEERLMLTENRTLTLEEKQNALLIQQAAMQALPQFPKDDEDAGVPREKARANAQNLLQILKKKQAAGEERKAAWLNA